VKRVIRVAGVASSTAALIIGATTAAAAVHKSKPAKAAAVSVKCTTKVGVMVADGDTSVTPPVEQGSEYGTALCSKLGTGVQGDSFTIADSGNTEANFTWYLRTGTVSGKYEVTPQEGTLNFLNVTYSGTLTVTGGTGTLHGIKGSGTMTCASQDGIHTSCTDKLKVKLPA
jgi:hypothetical protein